MSERMKYFAIRHKPTGKYLPQGSKKRGGFTSDTPMDMSKRPPRLFMKKHHAQYALDLWVKGRWGVRLTAEHDDFLVPSPVKGRNKDDMEIVEIEIIFPTQEMR